MRKRLSLVAINALLFLILAEIAAVVVYSVQHGGLFYMAEKPVPPALAETGRGELSCDGSQNASPVAVRCSVPFEDARRSAR